EPLPGSWTEKFSLNFWGAVLRGRSSLSKRQREGAVALFESGWGSAAVSTHLAVGRDPVRKLYGRWQLWGGSALVDKPTKRSFSFECKLEIVGRYLAGETKLELAREFDLSSPQLVATWARIFRNEGEDGLRPKPKGRRPLGDAVVREPAELEQLRRENERLRAEVAYLGKARALRAQQRR
ncbi:transposase, partial [Agreia sp. PsM10]|uniref:helix-turn-helix domain-containing protein n=1 Tax=Agreia sp. PsM10 TaxID=3030533 RepID=UPI00263B967B